MKNKINFTQLQRCYLVFHTSVWTKSTFIAFISISFYFIFQVIGIICMSLASPAILTSTHWFLFVVVTAFIATLLWVAVYFLGIREVLNLSVNWILTVSVLKYKYEMPFFLIHISKTIPVVFSVKTMKRNENNNHVTQSLRLSFRFTALELKE